MTEGFMENSNELPQSSGGEKQVPPDELIWPPKDTENTPESSSQSSPMYRKGDAIHQREGEEARVVNIVGHDDDTKELIITTSLGAEQSEEKIPVGEISYPDIEHDVDLVVQEMLRGKGEEVPEAYKDLAKQSVRALLDPQISVEQKIAAAKAMEFDKETTVAILKGRKQDDATVHKIEQSDELPEGQIETPDKTVDEPSNVTPEAEDREMKLRGFKVEGEQMQELGEKMARGEATPEEIKQVEDFVSKSGEFLSEEDKQAAVQLKNEDETKGQEFKRFSVGRAAWGTFVVFLVIYIGLMKVVTQYAVKR